MSKALQKTTTEVPGFLSDYDSQFSDALKWLMRSQYLSGPVAGLIPRRTRFYSRLEVYPEISGYALSTLSAWAEKQRNFNLFNRAQKTFEGLRQFMFLSGALPGQISKWGEAKNNIYLFDQAIMAQGLWDFLHVEKQFDSKRVDEDRKVALLATDFIVSQLQGGRLSDRVNQEGLVLDPFTYCILAKASLPLVSAFQETRDPKYLKATQELLTFNVKHFQKTDGRFCLDTGHIRNRVHYHCYAVEGLLKALELSELQSFFAAAKAGGDFLLGYQSENGGFKNYLPDTKDDGLEDVPPTAQAVLIWWKLWQRNPEAHYLQAMERGMKYLAHRQWRSAFKLVHGSLPFLIPHRGFREGCPWATEFFLDIGAYKT